MLTIPNALSLLRIPLALAFLQENAGMRALAIVLAMATDMLDGYLARRYKQTSRLGTLLDPIMDKLFVLVALSIFFKEGRLKAWEAGTLLCRDFSVVLFGLYLAWCGKLAGYRFRAIWCGKVTTFFQFGVLLGLTFGIYFPSYVYGVFVVLGLMALGELYIRPFRRGQPQPLK